MGRGFREGVIEMGGEEESGGGGEEEIRWGREGTRKHVRVSIKGMRGKDIEVGKEEERK